jgi:glycerol-3-phosphate acyltransferase PlsY
MKIVVSNSVGIGSASEGLENVYRILGKVVATGCDEPC